MGASKKRKQIVSQYLSKENLQKYLKIYSANFIAKTLFAPDFVTDASTVISHAQKHGLKTHSSSQARSLSNTKKLIKQTCQNNYGVDNPSQSEEIKKKKEISAIKNYGVINVFQSEEIKEKSRQTCIEKYGTPHVGYLGLGNCDNNGKLSLFHQEIQTILDNNNIKYESEVTLKFKKYNNFLKRQYSPIVDILLDEIKLVIECNGDFWHANPKIYKYNDIFHTWEGIKTSQDIWDKDKSRIKQIESFGYKVLLIWHSELKKNKQKVEKKILNVIKNQTNKKNRKRTNKI